MPTIDDESAQLMIPQHTHENGSRAVSYGLSPHQQPGGMRSINFQADELGLLRFVCIKIILQLSIYLFI